MIETKFKQTEIGLIPEDWRVEVIRNLSDVYSGGTPDTKVNSFWGGEIPWMNSGELNLKIVKDVSGRITELGLKFSSTHWIPAKCVLIGLFGQGKTRGTAAINMIPLCTNDAICAIYPSEKFDSFYLYYYIDSRYNKFREISDLGGGRGVLSKRLINETLVPIPPKEEQVRIANFLNDVDSLISSLDELIEKKQAIKCGAMQLLLSGKKRLAGFSEPWTRKKLCDIGSCYNGLSGKRKDDFGRGEAKYITFLNVLNNVVINTGIFESVHVSSLEKQNNVRKDDLFFNTSSETPEEVGICSVLLSDVSDLYLNSFCFGFRITDRGVLPLFVSYFFRSKRGRDMMYLLAQGVTRYNLSKKEFLNGLLLIPSSLQEQGLIVAILSDMDDEIAALKLKKAKYEMIKQGMMQQLLTGKIRLVE